MIQCGGAQVGDERAKVGDPVLEVVDRLTGCFFEHLQPTSASSDCQAEAHRGETLQGFVMELTGPAPALGFRRREALALQLGCRRMGGRDCGGGAGRERLQQSLILSRERRSVMQPVQSDEHTMGLVVKHERDDQTGLSTVSPSTVLPVRASAVQIALQALSGACSQRRAGDRVNQRSPLADQTIGVLAGCGRDDQLVSVDELDQQRPCRDERPSALGKQREDHLEVGRAGNDAGDLRGRLERRDRPRQRVAARCGVARSSRSASMRPYGGRSVRRRNGTGSRISSPSMPLPCVAAGVLGELDLEVVIDRLLESARELTGAQYAALGVLDASRTELQPPSRSDRRRRVKPTRGACACGALFPDALRRRLVQLAFGCERTGAARCWSARTCSPRAQRPPVAPAHAGEAGATFAETSVVAERPCS